MRPLWILATLPLLACSLRPGVDERTYADLQDSAVAAFVTARAEPDLPSEPLAYRAGGIYSAAPRESAGGARVWQVRNPRADIIVLPLEARDRLAGVSWKADVLLRYEDRTCEIAGSAEAASWCQPWQDATCCNQIWKRRRGEWLVSSAADHN
jgi:hypothetical protein